MNGKIVDRTGSRSETHCFETADFTTGPRNAAKEVPLIYVAYRTQIYSSIALLLFIIIVIQIVKYIQEVHRVHYQLYDSLQFQRLTEARARLQRMTINETFEQCYLLPEILLSIIILFGKIPASDQWPRTTVILYGIINQPSIVPD